MKSGRQLEEQSLRSVRRRKQLYECLDRDNKLGPPSHATPMFSHTIVGIACCIPGKTMNIHLKSTETVWARVEDGGWLNGRLDMSWDYVAHQGDR